MILELTAEQEAFRQSVEQFAREVAGGDVDAVLADEVEFSGEFDDHAGHHSGAGPGSHRAAWIGLRGDTSISAKG